MDYAVNNTCNDVDHINMSNVADRIGFEPQKDFKYLRCLPNVLELEQEAVAQLKEIRYYLPRAVALEDIHEGAAYWASRLNRYIVLYGEFFSKEDHVYFLTLVYNLVVWRELEPRLVKKFSALFNLLCRKRHCLCRRDLELDWRPLYDMYCFLEYSGWKKQGWLSFDSDVTTSLERTVAFARRFFPAKAVEEIWIELRHELAPYNQYLHRKLRLLMLFMPMAFANEEATRLLDIWFPTFVDFFVTFYRHQYAMSDCVNILSRVAINCPGLVDWEPVMDVLFTGLLLTLDLPVRDMLNPAQFGKFLVEDAACIIIHAIGSKSSGGIDRLRQLINSIETFYHPSNVGDWSENLSYLVVGLSQHLVDRVYYERSAKPSPDLVVTPAAECITDAQISEVVELLRPVIMTAVFSEMKMSNVMSVLTALRNISFLRPECVLPQVIEAIFPALGALVEPHRLADCLRCINVVVLPLVQNTTRYSAGRLQVVPLLDALLPAIDLNDQRKALLTLRVIRNMCNLIQLEDCSQWADCPTSNLNEEERELCRQTAQFSDWSERFLRRILELVESLDDMPTDQMRCQSEAAGDDSWNEEVQACVEYILRKTSAELQRSMGELLCQFVMQHPLNWRTAGALTSSLLFSFVRTNPVLAAQLFLPDLVHQLVTQLSTEEEVHAEPLDWRVLWQLTMLKSIFLATNLLDYRAEVLVVFRLMSRVRCQHAMDLLADLLDNALSTLTNGCLLTPPLNRIHLTEQQRLPIHTWGQLVKWNECCFRWRNLLQLPNDAMVALAQEILDLVVSPIVASLERMCSAQEHIETNMLFRLLRVIRGALQGCEVSAHPWKSAPLARPAHANVSPSASVNIFLFGASINYTWQVFLDGVPMRERLRVLARRILSYLMQHREADTRALVELVALYRYLLLPFDNYSWMSKMISDRLTKNLESMCQSRLLGKTRETHVAHYYRLCLTVMQRLNFSSRSADVYTLELVQDLTSLALSRYESPRQAATSLLATLLARFRCLDEHIVPQLSVVLRDAEDRPEHEVLGAMEALTQLWKKVRLNWKLTHLATLALFHAKLSKHVQQDEVESTLELLRGQMIELSDTLNVRFPSAPPRLVNVCRALLPALPDAEVASAKLVLNNESEQRFKSYLSLTLDAIALASANSTNWQLVKTIIELIPGEWDTVIDPQVTQMLLSHLLSSVPVLRSFSASVLVYILYKDRFIRKRKEINPIEVAGLSKDTVIPASPPQLSRGPRLDNLWMLADISKNVTHSEEAWLQHMPINNNHIGFVGWPKHLLVYDQAHALDSDRSLRDMSLHERQVFHFFTETDAWSDLIKHMTSRFEEDFDDEDMEDANEVDEEDKFPTASFVQALSKCFGPPVFKKLLPLINDLLETDPGDEKEEIHHKCASMVVEGLLRGARHWNYVDVKWLVNFIISVLERVVQRVGEKGLVKWAETFTEVFGYNRYDPMVMAPVVQHLYSELQLNNGTPFRQGVRLKLLLPLAVGGSWRSMSFSAALQPFVFNNLANADAKLRDICSFFLHDWLNEDYERMGADVRYLAYSSSEILASELLPRLQNAKDYLLTTCFDEYGTNGTVDLSMSSSSSCSSGAEVQMQDTVAASQNFMESESAESNDANWNVERKRNAVSTIRCILFGLRESCDMQKTAPSAALWLALPSLLELSQVAAFDPQLQIELERAFVSYTFLQIAADCCEAVLRLFVNCAQLSSWKARENLLKVVQGVVFSSQFVLNNETARRTLRDLVLTLLCDETLEVRKRAAETLSGLVRCNYLPVDSKLQNQLIHWSEARLRKRAASSTDGTIEAMTGTISESRQLVKRHAGILGLCAIIEAFPYTVSAEMPRLLMRICAHANDPQPIRSAVKDTLRLFKRTHQDAWHDQRKSFTEEQLLVLTDLLISPNYYA